MRDAPRLSLLAWLVAATGACGGAGGGARPDAGGAAAGTGGTAGRAQNGDGGAAGTSGPVGPDGGVDLGITAVLVTGAAAESLVGCDGGAQWIGGDGAVAADGGGAAADGGAAAADGGSAGDWSHRFGDQWGDSALGVAAGGDGTALLLSTQYQAVDFGEGSVMVAGCSDTFLSSFSETGAHRWSRTIGHWPDGLAAGADGGAFVMLDGGTLVRLDPDGHPLWARTINASASGTVRFRNGALFSELQVGNPSAIVLERLSLDGDRLWSFALPAPNLGYVLDASPAAELVIGLWFEGSLVFGGKSFTAKGNAGDFVVAKLDAAGQLAWTRQLGSLVAERLVDLVVSADGSIVVLGDGTEATDFGLGPLGPGSDSVSFLARLDAGGTLVGARALISPPVGSWLRALPSGGLIVGDSFQGAISVAGTTVHTGAMGDVDVLVVETAPTFEVQRIWHFGNGGGGQELQALAVDPAGALLLAGQFEGKLDLGSGLLRSAGVYDVFVGRVTP